MPIEEPYAGDRPFPWDGRSIEQAINDLNWDVNPIGAPAGWPLELKATLSNLLASPFPMHLCVGEQHIQLYNDAFSELLRRTGRAQALGISVFASFPEHWELMDPVLAKVRSGASVKLTEQRLSSADDDHQAELYLDLYLSPVADQSGKVIGVLTNVVETTRAVQDHKLLEELRAELQVLTHANNLQREMLIEFLMNSPTSVCILGGEQLIFEFVNPVYQALFPGRELLGKGLVEALPELAADPIIEILAQVMRTGKAFHATDRLVPSARTTRGEIEDRYFDFSYQPRLDEYGRPNGVLVYSIEVTERRKRELGAREYLQLVTGEIQRPLSSLRDEIRYFGKRSSVLGEDEQSLGRVLDRAEQHMCQISQMINTYLNLSSLNSGKLELTISLFDLEKLITEVVEEMQPGSPLHTLSFVCTGIKNVRGDRSRIEYVLRNLLASAIKYSPGGGEILIECAMAGAFVEVMVMDNGLGVRAQELEQVFQYLNHEVISSHGGKIWTERAIGASSSFHFSLPH
ncbi:MAG: hypothetical protein EOO88_00170 [Pedobacter sp.]|nr:MAG: hypothetical protein EOO88_00170 [Pedobacter sp.]